MLYYIDSPELLYCSLAKAFQGRLLQMGTKTGYRNCEQTSERLYTVAQNGIPVLPNSLSTTIVITEAIRVLHEIEASRNTILSQMQALAKTLPEYQVAREMSCIGDVLAPKAVNMQRYTLAYTYHTEGCINKIKVLKRNAYGYRNFNRFRKIILHMFNYKKSGIGKAAA